MNPNYIYKQLPIYYSPDLGIPRGRAIKVHKPKLMTPDQEALAILWDCFMWATRLDAIILLAHARQYLKDRSNYRRERS